MFLTKHFSTDEIFSHQHNHGKWASTSQALLCQELSLPSEQPSQPHLESGPLILKKIILLILRSSFVNHLNLWSSWGHSQWAGELSWWCWHRWWWQTELLSLSQCNIYQNIYWDIQSSGVCWYFWFICCGHNNVITSEKQTKRILFDQLLNSLIVIKI